MLALAVVNAAACSKPALPAAQRDASLIDGGEVIDASLVDAALDGDATEADHVTDAGGEPSANVGQAVLAPRKDAPALRYGRMSRHACEAELVRRKIPFARAEATAGVRSPVRLTGPLRGVSIHSESSAKRRAKARFEIFDCRLVLAMDDFADIVARKDVVEILHMSAFRSWRERGCLSKVGSKQHCGALAVDVGTFVKRDGTRLVVDRDFNGRIGQGTCVPRTGPAPATPEAAELWSYVCDASRETLFNVVLTPNYNADHHNHFHLEVTPGVDWVLVH